MSKKQLSLINLWAGWCVAFLYDGQALPVIEGVNFKNISLSGTDRLRVSRTVCCSASVGKKSGVTTSSSTTTYVATHERSGASQHYVRVNVRTGNTSSVLENSRMIIQIFSKNISGKGGYSELRTDAVDLPKLEGGKAVTVECQPVVTSMKSVRSMSSYSEYISSASNTGKDFMES